MARVISKSRPPAPRVMVNRGKSGVRVSVPVSRPSLFMAGLRWVLACRGVTGPVRRMGRVVVVAVVVGKALYKQLSALLAGRRAGAALPE